MGKLVVLYGPSCSGKTEIAVNIGLEKVPTMTTRDKRENEVDGVDYHFTTKKKFNDLLRKGEIIEHTEYVGNFYGCPRKDILETIKGDSSKVIVLDIKGVQYLKNNFSSKNIKYVYIGANLESIKRRLEERSIPEEELISRLSKAEVQELSHKYRELADEIIWNNDGMNIEDVVNHIKKLLKIWKY